VTIMVCSVLFHSVGPGGLRRAGGWLLSRVIVPLHKEESAIKKDRERECFVLLRWDVVWYEY
jgi:hypothetical protein